MPKKRAAQPTGLLKIALSVVRKYEHALVNIAKLAGEHRLDDGRLVHDPASLAGRVLEETASDLWREVDRLPYNVLDLSDDGEVSVNAVKLTRYKRRTRG